MNIKRRLGQSDIMLSPLGVGTWQFSNKGGTWNTVTDKTVYEILKYSLTNGMNWIDTAEIYGNGISETLIGQALKQLEAEKALTDIPYIADKWFPLFTDGRHNYKDDKSAFGLSTKTCNRLISDTSANLSIFLERTDTAYG